MHRKITWKKIVQICGCAAFCFVVCLTAFLNRTLIMEPMSEFLFGRLSFVTTIRHVKDNYLSDRFRGKNKLLSLNGGLARLEGRIRYNDVQRMTNGMLTSIVPAITNTDAFCNNLIKFHRFLEKKGIPFLFIMAPYKVPVGETMLPTGVTDMTNAITDQALAKLIEQNVPVLDLRQKMSQTREQVEKFFYRTDHHWNVEGSFFAYQQIMEAIQDQIPETKMTFVDPALWEKNVISNWWLGSHGRRVGPLFGGVDDLDYYLPVFETKMARYSLGVWAAKGDFRKVSIWEWFLNHSDYFNLDNYHRYLGGGYPLTLHRNEIAENRMKLLLLRDSFMLPVECFLSTELSSIDVLDPREYGIMSEMDYVTLNPPDMIIMMIYPGVLPSNYYEYYTNFGEDKDLEILGESAWAEITVSEMYGDRDYEILPVHLESGMSYQLTLDCIQVNNGDPDGASLVLYNGDNIVDQTIFDIDYGNQFDFCWGFQIPTNKDMEGDYQLRLYAGVNGRTEGIELVYQGIRLKEGVLRKP